MSYNRNKDRKRRRAKRMDADQWRLIQRINRDYLRRMAHREAHRRWLNTMYSMGFTGGPVQDG